jgi:Flp pilus assembly protein TadD
MGLRQMQNKMFAGSRQGRRSIALLLLACLGGCASTPPLDPEVPAGDPRAGIVAEIATVRKAIEKAPQDPGLFYKLGNLLFDMGRYSEAAQAYQQTVTLKPDHANGYTNLGLSLRRVGQFRAAIGAYEYALDLTPGDPDTLRNLIVAADLAGDAERALNARKRLVEADPKDTKARAELAKLYFESGQYQEAALVYARIIELDPGHAGDHYILGRCHYFTEQPEAAETAWKKALDCDPKHPSTNRGLATLYWARGDFERAWMMVDRCQTLGIPVDPAFLQTLQRDSGRAPIGTPEAPAENSG